MSPRKARGAARGGIMAGGGSYPSSSAEPPPRFYGARKQMLTNNPRDEFEAVLARPTGGPMACVGAPGWADSKGAFASGNYLFT